jgi:hypothetical protein
MSHPKIGRVDRNDLQFSRFCVRLAPIICDVTRVRRPVLMEENGGCAQLSIVALALSVVGVILLMLAILITAVTIFSITL